MGPNTEILARHSSPLGGKSMNRRLIPSLLITACVVTPLAAVSASPAKHSTHHAKRPVSHVVQHVAAPPSVMRPSNDIVLSIGRGQLVTTGGAMTDVFVANDAVADVQVKSTHQIYIFGKAGGETTVYASNAAGETVWSANVRVGSNIESVDQMLRMAMPEAKIGIATMGTNTFLLTGTVASPEDAAEAERLVKAFVGGSKDADVNVVSRLRTATPLQVNLQVRFAEVSRTLMKSLSSNLTTIDGTGGFQFGIGQGRQAATTYYPGGPMGFGTTVQQTYINPVTGQTVTIPGTALTPTTTGTTLAAAGKLLGLNILGTLDAGETIGLVSTLAQPNLTALSGETADFLAGGEFPIPTSQGLGATSIEYKKFGVSLSYTPTVLANGRISLRVRPEVSELSSQGAVQINGFSIPALTVRRTETTIELGSGQSFMIAGLLQNSAQNTVTKMPGAGDVPILGALFRSTAFQKGETELVIVVTPYLVNPVDSQDIKLPTDGYNAPNELQRILGNQEGDSISGAKRPGPHAAPAAKNAPSVGAADPAVPAPTAPAGSAAADVPKPGFNLK
jgi:pilus assembly protein CpaC